MSTHSHASHRLDKTGFRLRWRAKLAPYPAPIRAAGFTLIELSIVLVIIGLLVGGVLVGQDLIKAAQLRADISYVEKLKTSANTFRLKYNCLPGDCAQATTYGFTDNGNNNRILDTGQEAARGYFIHLMQAEFITETPVTSSDVNIYVKLKSGSGCVLGSVQEQSGAFSDSITTQGDNYIHDIMSRTRNGGTITVAPCLSVLGGYNIDQKIDDGFPTTGKVQSTAGYTYNRNAFLSVVGSHGSSGPAGDGVSCMTNDATPLYNNIDSDGLLCGLGMSIR